MKNEVFAILSQQRKDTVNSFPSIFTREDVLAILDKVEGAVSLLEEEKSTTINLSELRDLIAEKVSDSINNDGDLIDDYDLELCGREIEIVSVTFNDHYLSSAIKSGIDEAIEEWEEARAEVSEEDL